MKTRKFVAILIGLLLIALMAYQLYEVDRHSIPLYFTNTPEFLNTDLVNTIVFYTLFGIKVMAVFLIAVGNKKTIGVGLFFLLISILEIYYTNWPMLSLLYDAFKAIGISAFLESLGTSGYLYLSALVLLFVFWLVMLIVMLAKKEKTLGGKITLLIIALLPVTLHYLDVLIILDEPYQFEQWETINIFTSYGLPIFISLMLLFSQIGKKKVNKNVWFPAIETL